MRCQLTIACCLYFCLIGSADFNSAVGGDELPSATELRALILEPLRSLSFGSLTLRTTNHVMHRSVTRRLMFKDDCIRVDTYGLAEVTVVSDRAGNKKPYEVDPSTTFVERQAICGDEYVNYNPAKSVDGSKFSVGVKKMSDPATVDRVRGFFFDPRYIGVTPNLIGHLRLDSLSNSLYETVAVEATVSKVMIEEQEVVLLSQTRDRGQIIRHWITDNPNHSVIMAEVRSGAGPNRSGTRLKFTNKQFSTPVKDVSFPIQIEEFLTEIDGVEKLWSVHEVEEIDFLTPVDDRVFTVLGMEPTEGTHVYTQPPQLHPLQEIRDGQIVPATRIDSEPKLPSSISIRAWLLAINIVAVIICFGVARSMNRRSAE